MSEMSPFRMVCGHLRKAWYSIADWIHNIPDMDDSCKRVGCLGGSARDPMRGTISVPLELRRSANQNVDTEAVLSTLSLRDRNTRASHVPPARSSGLHYLVDGMPHTNNLTDFCAT